MNKVKPLMVGESLQLNCSVGIQTIDLSTLKLNNEEAYLKAFQKKGNSIKFESTIYKTTVNWHLLNLTL